jgi:hypothetical protein
MFAQSSSPAQWTTAILGQPPAAYSTWILDSKHWGGAIELAILSEYYAVEIAAIQIETAKLYVYGEGKYKERVYLVYTGIHYDVLVAAQSSGAGAAEVKSGAMTAASDVVRFASDDALALAQIMSLATQWQQVTSHRYEVEGRRGKRMLESLECYDGGLNCCALSLLCVACDCLPKTGEEVCECE